MRVLGRATAVAAALAACLTVAACGGGSSQAGSGSTAGGQEDGLTLYNAQHESLMKLMTDGFTKQTGVKVTMRSGDDFELANQLVQEGEASPADVFVTENSPAMALVDSKNLFAKVETTTLGQVPTQFAPTDGDWVGFAARSTVFAYNSKQLQKADLPASLLDLADPKFYQGNIATMKAVNAGQIAVGIIYLYYWYRDCAESGANSKDVELHFFGNQDPGAFLSLSGAGVLRSSKKAEQAQQLVEYLTSPA